jgi:transposase
MERDPRTRSYVARRTKEGESTPEITRCLKRQLAREIYHALTITAPAEQPPGRSALTPAR